MFNLLPENLIKKIKTEYKFRLVIVSMIFIILIQVSFLTFLFPSWLTSLYREKEVSLRSDEMNKFLSALEIASTTSYIKSINDTLSIIDATLEYPKLVPILDSVLSKKTSSIRIDGIYYSAESKNTGLLTITGLGDSRESLVSLTKNLGEIEYLKKVDLPISNLAKDKNIDFSININIEK